MHIHTHTHYTKQFKKEIDHEFETKQARWYMGGSGWRKGNREMEILKI